MDEVMLWLLGIAFCGLAFVLLHTSGTDPSAAAGGALSSKLWGATRALRAAVASAWRSLHAALQSGMQEVSALLMGRTLRRPMDCEHGLPAPTSHA